MTETTDRKPVLVIVVGTLAALLAYVGTYLTTVDPMPVELEVGGGGSGSGVPYVMDAYRLPIDPGMASSFFSPIHEIDRRVRPQIWEPTP